MIPLTFPHEAVHKIILIWTELEAKRETMRDIQEYGETMTEKQKHFLKVLQEEIWDLLDYDLGDQMYELMSWRDKYLKEREQIS